MVLMDDRLFAAHDVTKTNSTRVETFQAPERGPLAIVDPEGLAYRSKSPGRAAAQFDISDVKELPRVDVVYSYAGADSVVIDAAGCRGCERDGDRRRGAGRHDGVAERGGRKAPSRRAWSSSPRLAPGRAVFRWEPRGHHWIRRPQSAEGASPACSRAHSHERSRSDAEDLHRQPVTAIAPIEADGGTPTNCRPMSLPSWTD